MLSHIIHQTYIQIYIYICIFCVVVVDLSLFRYTGSSVGLGDLYENEYLDKQREEKGDGGSAASDALSKQHMEIDILFRKLNNKLDALSNFHYTPSINDIHE